MEKTLEKGEQKIQKICDALRRETLEPAQQEAEKIVEDAKAKADQIIKDAHHQAERHLEEAKADIEKERNVFHSSLEQAGRQALEELRQSIEKELFSRELQKVVEEKGSDPELIAKLIKAIVNAIEKEGISTDISAVIPKAVSTKDVNAALGDGILKKLQDNGVALGRFGAGAQVKLIDKRMVLDITDKALIELLSTYVRKDFRNLIFKS